MPDQADDSASWLDETFVRQWLAQDQHKKMLDFPRQLTAAVIAQEQKPSLVIDIASGPGTYLGVLLDAFPDAHGIWTDASSAMLEAAKPELERYGDRVTFQLVDMQELGDAGLPVADVIVTSRAAHHLPYPELLRFYQSCRDGLAPGGWIANLDHTEPPAVWNDRYRAIRKRRQTSEQGRAEAQLPRHRHDQPRPRVSEHLDALTAAGFDDPELLWKAFHTCLFMARRGDEHQPA